MNRYTLLYQHFLSHKESLLKGSAALVCVNLLVLANPLILKESIDALIAHQQASAIMWALGYLFLALLQSAGRYLWRIHLLTGATHVEKTVRTSLLSALFSASVQEVHKETPGQVMARATNDISAFRRVFDGGIIVCFDAILFLIAAPFAMWYLSPSLTILSLLPIPLIPLCIRFFNKRIKRRFTAVQSTFGDMLELARQSLAGLRHIRAGARERTLCARFEHLGHSYIDKSLSLAWVECFHGPCLDMIMAVSIGIALYCGGHYVIDGTMTVGSFIAFHRYLANLRWPAQATGVAITILQKGLVSSDRILSILQMETDADISVHKSTPNPMKVEVRNLTWRYPDTEVDVLKEVSFVVNPGERLSILGDVGSGKSTLVSILNSTLQNFQGDILIDGNALSSIPLSERRHAIRSIPQDTYIFNRSVRENLRIGASNLQQPDIVSACRSAAIYQEVLTMPEEFETILGEKGVMVSGGQRQRLTIARALLSESGLLIFDDSLSSVDIKTEAEILDALEAERGKRTEIFVTQRLSTAQYSDKVLVLDNGSVSFFGTHKDALANSRWYRRFVETQQIEEKLLSMEYTHASQ